MKSASTSKLSMREAQHLREDGWVKLTSDVHNEAGLRSLTLELASGLGKPVRGRSQDVVEALTPKNSENAPPASLSKKYGLDAFPFHVDAAHWTVPARYLILCCVNPGDSAVPTQLVHRDMASLSEGEHQAARSGVFLFKNGRKSFYSSIFSLDREFIRYDPGCMEPQTPDADQALQLFSHERLGRLAHTVDWQAGDVVIIDNWQMLHARAGVNKSCSNRLLLRCLIS